MNRSLHGVIVSMLAMVMVLGQAAAGAAADKFEREVEKEQGAVKLAREAKRGDYDLIAAAELKSLLDSGKEVLVVDTMPFDASYKRQHVPGAVQFLFPVPDMPVWDTGETGGKTADDYAALLGPDKYRTIVVYCGFVKCTRSHNGAVWAKKLGYRNVFRFSGGIYAWKGAGYPVESAP